MTAGELVSRALRKVARSSHQSLREGMAPAPHLLQADMPRGFTLRVVGRQQYLVSDLALWKYAPVQEALNHRERLRLQLVENSSIELPGERRRRRVRTGRYGSVSSGS